MRNLITTLSYGAYRLTRLIIGIIKGIKEGTHTAIIEEDKKVIHIKHLIHPTYLAWGFGILALVFAVQGLFIWSYWSSREERTISNLVYIKDKVALDRIISESDRYTKITTFYSAIIAHYFQKWHDKYNSADKWMYQGLSKAQVTSVINLWYEGSRELGLPCFSLPVIALIESSGNPLSRTFYDDGTLKEAGLYNNRREAVVMAQYYYALLPERLKKMLTFNFTIMEDLFDPINATKIELVLAWGEKTYYGDNQAWWITSLHWGNHKIAALRHTGILPPRDYKFNTGELDEDVRNPFTYYFWWNMYNSQFEMFDIRVFIDKHWEVVYREQCGKQEAAYLNSWKYFQDMIDLYNTLRKDKETYFCDREKKVYALEEKIKNMNAYYIETQGILTTGRFKNINDVYTLAREQLRLFLKDVQDEKNRDSRIWIIITLSGFIIVILFIAILLLMFTIKYFMLKRKRRLK